jgi:hypothetical protein
MRRGEWLLQAGDLLHPPCSIIFSWPSVQATWKILFWDVPLCAILVLSQPNPDLVGSLLMVNLGYDEWPMVREEVSAAA